MYNTGPDDGKNDRNRLLIWKYTVMLEVIWLFMYWTRVIYTNLCLRDSNGEGPFRPPWSVHVRILVDQVTLIQVFLWLIRFSPIGMIQPMFHTHLHLNVDSARRTKWEAWEPSERNSISENKEHWIGKHFHLYNLQIGWPRTLMFPLL
jgi:hypothetical protein